MAVIKGLDSLMRKLNALGGNSEQAAIKGMQKATLLVEGDAKDLCAVDTGQLRNSINSKVEVSNGEVIGIVGTNVSHGAYVEFGTGQRGAASPQPPEVDVSYSQDWVGMEAQPFLYPALRQNKDNITKLISRELRREIRKLGG